MPNKSQPIRATIEDVAAYAGVSTATVSRVINNTGTVAKKTSSRVWAAISELDYIPHAAARRLASRKTKTLGLLLPEIGDNFFSALLRGISNAVNESGYALLIYSSLGRLQRNNGDYYLPIGEHNADGLITFTESLSPNEIIRLHKRQFPMVILNQSPPKDVDIPYITLENKGGVRNLMEHLIKVHGYRRIAFLKGPIGNEDSHWREMGYREALKAHDIPFDPTLISNGGFNASIAEAVVADWLQGGLEFDAIFTGDDAAAVGAMLALREAGKQIPDDVAVVGFDDILLSRYLTPSLTTVRAPIEQMGQEATRQLVQFIETGHAESLVLLPTELVIRRSCGCSLIT